MSNEQRAEPGAVFLSGCEPVRVWFAWHPECEGGTRLANELAAALGELGGADRAGTGVPTYFATSGDPHRVPLNIPLGCAEDETIVVPLLDSHFVADPRWRAWIGALAHTSAHILPVALDGSAYQLDSIRGRGYLPSANDAAHLKRVMLVDIARLLLKGKRPKLFLSYATADGGFVARALRDAVARYPRMDFFLDIDNLNAGDDFAQTLRRTVDAEAPAMIAIHTDQYGSRPWCRRELASFRRPRQMPSGVWHLRTLVVVDHLHSGVARVLGELAGAPLLRYIQGEEPSILDRVVRALVLGEYHCRRADRVLARRGELDDAVAIDWVPDAHTLGVLNRTFARPPSTLWFPGGGLERMELDAIREASQPQLLETFNSVLEQRTDARARPRTVVGLSIGAPSEDDLTRRGMGEHHLSTALDRLAGLLIGHGFDVSFGGRLESGFTWELSEALTGYVRSETAFLEGPVQSGELPHRPLLVNFERAPGEVDHRQIARGLGLVRFVASSALMPYPAVLKQLYWKMGEPPVETEEHDSGPWDEGSSIVRELTWMRWSMNGGREAIDGLPVAAPVARVVIGGKTDGFGGVLPGIIEEALYAVEQDVPIFIVGLLGGAAHAFGEVIFDGRDPGAALPWTNPASLAGRDEADIRLAEFANRSGELVLEDGTPDLWGRYDVALRYYRQSLGALRQRLPDNGLTREENRRLFEARDLDTVIHLLSKGLTELLRRNDKLADPSP